VQGLARDENHDIQLKPGLFVDSLTVAAVQVRGGLPRYLVRRVREYIDSNINQRIKVETLAKLVNLSVCYFVRAFKQSTGLTPRKYLTRRRLDRAVELLSATDMPILDIAFATRFADQSHCARRFRQHVGMSPRDYRRAST
jgi:AraC-like DNA-binding protein